MKILRSKDLILSGLLSLFFILLTKIIPYLLIHNKILYDKEGIIMKAEEMANILSWPLSSLLSSDITNSYYFIFFVFIYYLTLIFIFRWIHHFIRDRKLYRWLFLFIIISITILRIKPDLLVYLDNEKPSRSIGNSGDGGLINGKRLPFKGNNFQYFNFLSYLKGNCFVHEKVKQTLIDAYKICEKTCPGIEFSTGEGSKKHGGSYVVNHRTHQNGTSLDLQLVFEKEHKQYEPNNLFNAYGYGLNTDDNGTINKSIPINIYPENTRIDFETNAKFLLALDDACRKNKIKIKIVILKVELKRPLFETSAGKQLLTRNILFANVLPNFVNDAHDDHFHVDFEIAPKQ